MQLVEADLE
jgi:hypothetical protein